MKIWRYLNGLKPIIVMVIVQVIFATVNIMYKLAANDGMNLRILIAYRLLFASAFIVPLAFFLERKSRPKLTWTIVGQAFLSGLLGGSLTQNLGIESIMFTSATFATALANLVPAVTFILGLSFGLEKLSLDTKAGKAKILGTLLGISGAMVLTFYKGLEIKLWSTNIHLLKPRHITPHHSHNYLIGSLMGIATCFTYAAWLIVQAKMSKKYPCYYSSIALMCIMGSIQSVGFALAVERDWNEWKLGWNIRLLAVSFNGIVASGIAMVLVAWCIRERGPLFVSVFNPLMVVVVAIAGSLMLNEKLYIGSVLGGLLIVLGLYGVVWGKGKEMKMMNTLVPEETGNNDSDGIEIVTSDEQRATVVYNNHVVDVKSCRW